MIMLYVDASGGDPTADLESISGNDGALGVAATTTPITTSKGVISAYQVQYAAATTGLQSATRLALLATNNATNGANWDYDILIGPVGVAVNPYNMHSFVGGVTFLDTGGNKVIHVVYDIGQCEGAGIRCFDTSANPISTPGPVVLYHELSHAYHFALNQFPYPQDVCSGASFVGSDEPAAELDENQMRQELGLCLRNPCNHEAVCGSGNNCSGLSYFPLSGGSSGGFSMPSGFSHPSMIPSGPASMPPSGPPSHMPSGPPSPTMPSGPASPLPANFPSGGHATGNAQGCFIVSAATGSAQSSEVALLQQLRKQLASTSGVCGQLIQGILSEYYRFSPQFASGLDRDGLAKMAVLNMIVRPLVAWFNLARVVGFEWDDKTAVSVAAQDVLTACPRRMAKQIVPLLEAIRAGRPFPVDAPRQLIGFAPKLREAGSLPLVSWALLDSLLRAWTVTTRHVDVIGEVADWLAVAPIEPFVRSISPELLDEELATLAGFFGFRQSARLRMGSRLAAALPESAEALKRFGFIEQ
jgi:hypothetical protein